MPKFQAASIQDLMTDIANAARVVRKDYYRQHGHEINITSMAAVVCVEADDGSWFEFDAETEDHAKVLARNVVDTQSARGASCWTFDNAGRLKRKPFYTYFAPIGGDYDDDEHGVEA